MITTLALLALCQVPLPETAAEISGYTRTSTTAEVRAFLDALAAQPHAARLARSVIGSSQEGRPLELVTVADPQPTSERDLLRSERIRVFVNADIHGGEVEGKEAVQMLLREFSTGAHAELLRHAVVFVLPVYNADGNDRIARTNRVAQNGPDGGVGARENAAGLDLNRDFVKVESPEAAALVPLLTRLDPHIFIDLHTTNGTDHGYVLTYATSLTPGLDADLERYTYDTFLPTLRERMQERHGYATFDYGNLARAREGELPRWQTYDHRPRFGTNLVGLRNRIGLLSEAYSYLDFQARVEVTRAFVLEALTLAVRDRERLRALTTEADRRMREDPRLVLPVEARLAPGREFELRLGTVREVELDLGDGTRGRRRIATGEVRTVPALAEVRFAAGREVELGLALDGGWAIARPSPGLLRALTLHGVEHRITATELVVDDSAVFRLSDAPRARRPFQGHLERRFQGVYEAAVVTLPQGACIVPRRQPLARLAAWLLEPESDDSLGTWNLFDGEVDAALADGASGYHPVYRLRSGL